jgi:hypothetical protein
MYNDDQYEEIEDPIEDDTSVEETILKEDKIFNNRYNTGDGLVESEDYEYRRKISVSSDYSNEYLKDLYEYEDALDTKLILNSIFEFVQKDPEIIILINKKTNKPFSNKLKLSKDEVNFLFNRINDSLDKKGSENLFYNPIYAMEVISSITSIEYKKLFDMMETEIQEILLIELNNKYKILDGKIHKKRIH